MRDMTFISGIKRRRLGVILGPPGSGKTRFAVEMVLDTVQLGGKAAYFYGADGHPLHNLHVAAPAAQGIDMFDCAANSCLGDLPYLIKGLLNQSPGNGQYDLVIAESYEDAQGRAKELAALSDLAHHYEVPIFLTAQLPRSMMGQVGLSVEEFKMVDAAYFPSAKDKEVVVLRDRLLAAGVYLWVPTL